MVGAAAALGMVNKGLDLLARIALKKDGRVFDPKQGQVIGGNTLLHTPAAAQTNLVQIPVEGNNSVSITPIMESRAEQQSTPEVISVSIMPPNAAFVELNDDAAALWDLKARIDWGTGGGQATADVDIKNGTMVTVLGTYVRVSALYTCLSGANNLPSGLAVNASASYGGRGGSNAPPTWTGFLASLATGGDFQKIFIPALARDLTVYALDLTTGNNCDIEISWVCGNIVLSDTVQTGATTINPTYRVPGMANQVGFLNKGAHACTIVAVFGIGL